jgi:hypothetical protein
VWSVVNLLADGTGLSGVFVEGVASPRFGPMPERGTALSMARF